MNRPLFLMVSVFLLLTTAYVNVHNLADYPPGVSYDEATSAVDAGMILQSGRLDFTFYADARVEMSDRIFLALMGGTGGQSLFVYRLTTVFLGLLTVAAAGLAAQAYFIRFQPAVRYWAAIAAMTSLTLNLTFMTLSRAIYRALPAVLFSLLFFACFWLALDGVLRRQKSPTARSVILQFGLAGVFIGLTMHTYTSALVAAGLVPVAGVWLVIFRWRQWRKWLLGLVIVSLILGAFLSPVLYLLGTNPDRVLNRSEDVDNPETRQLLQDMLTLKSTDFAELHWEWLKIRYLRKGDANPQYNADRAPLMPRHTTPLFYLALAACLMFVFRYESAQILVLFVLSLLPVILSSELFHGLRMILGLAVVPLFCGVAVGYLASLWVWGNEKINLPILILKPLQYVALAGLLLYIPSEVQHMHQRYRAFFDDRNPANEPRQGDELGMGEWYFRPQYLATARYLHTLEEPIYLAADDLSAAHLRAALLVDYPTAHSWDQLPLDEDGLPILPDGIFYAQAGLGVGEVEAHDYHLVVLLSRADNAIYVLPPLTDETHDFLRNQAPQGTPIYADYDPQEVIGYTTPTGTISDFLQFAPHYPTKEIIFEERVQAVAFTRPEVVKVNEAQTYCIIWKALRPIERRKVAYIQLWSADSYGLFGTVDQVLRWLYPTNLWEVGQRVATCHLLRLPTETFTGLQWLAASFLEPEANIPYWDATDINGNPVGQNVAIAPIKVPNPDPVSPPSQAMQADFQVTESPPQTISLIGYDLTMEADRLHLRLYWQSTGATQIPYTVFVHLENAEGGIIAQQDSQPWQGRYPTIIWDAGELIRTEHEIIFSADFSLSAARLWVGLYNPYTFERLPLGQADEIEDNNRVEITLTED